MLSSADRAWPPLCSSLSSNGNMLRLPIAGSIAFGRSWCISRNGERSDGTQPSRHRRSFVRFDRAYVSPAVIGAKPATKLSARMFFGGGLGIVGVADLLLAFAAGVLSAPLATWGCWGVTDQR